MSRWLLIVLMMLVLFILPKPLLAQEPDTANQVDGLAWSPEGDKLAVGYADGTIAIIDVSSGQVLHTLRGHSDGVWELAWKSDGSQLISGSEDTTARVWNALNGRLLAVLSGISPTLTLGVTWSQDSSRIITYGFDINQNFRVWDAVTYQLVYSDSPGGDIVQIVFSPDGSQVALANGAGQLLIADPVTFEAVKRFDEPLSLEGGTFGVYVAAWHPNGNLVAGGNWAGDVRLWNVSTGQNIFNLRATDSVQLDWAVTPIRALHFSSDGSRLSSIAADGTFRTWDISSGTILQTKQLGTSPTFAAAWSPDGTKLAYGGLEGVVILILEPARQSSTFSITGR